MLVISVTEKTVEDYLRSLIVDDEIKQYVHYLMREEDVGCLEFLYEVFKNQLLVYEQLSSSYIGYTQENIKEISNSVRELLGTNIAPTDILVANRTDLQFDSYMNNFKELGKFHNSFYEYLFGRLSDFITEQKASYCFDEVVNCIEDLVTHIEIAAIHSTSQISTNETMWLYVELKHRHLFLVYH